MVKTSRITSYLGIISVGLAIISGILSYSLVPDVRYMILIPGLFIGLLMFPSIVCSYFDLKVKKQKWGFNYPPEKQSIGRVLSLCYGVSYLFLGIMMSVFLTIHYGSTFINKYGLLFSSWIIIGILGIIGFILYRDTPRSLSSDDRLKMRKIGISTIMVCSILLVTLVLVINTSSQYYRTLNVSQDAYVYEHYPDINYGQEYQIIVGNYELGKTEAYYQFDVSYFSNDWTDAYLKVNFDFASFPVNVGVCIIYENWDEMSITWNNKPNHTTRHGRILCDGFDFHVPVKPEHFINNKITICLYGIGAESDGYLLGNSKEGAISTDDIPLAYLEYEGVDPYFIIGYIIAYVMIVAISVFYLKHPEKIPFLPWQSRMFERRERMIELQDFIERLRTHPHVNRPIFDPRMRSSELYKPREIFKINELVDLRLIGNKTYIFVNNKRLMICTFLLINIPKDKIQDYDEIKSIDEAAEILDKSLERTPPFLYKISPEEEFRAHCSNIQAFFENGLNTNILHSNVAFPLLKELVQQGYEPAKKVFKEEIATRFNEGTSNSRQFLYLRGYLNYLSKEERQALKGYDDFLKYLPEWFSTSRNIPDRLRRGELIERLTEFRPRRDLRDISERSSIMAPTLKVVIFGDSNVGKKLLTSKFAINIFAPDQAMTIGVDFSTKVIVVNGRTVRLQLWTLSSGSRFRFLIPSYFIGAQGGFFIFDLTNYASLTIIEEYLTIIRSKFRENEIFPLIFVGNKSDMSNKREISKENALEFAKSKGANAYIECSFQTGKNVEKMFEGLVQLILKRSGL